MDTTSEMCFTGTDVVKGSYLYSLAETLALAIMDEKAVVAQVGNVKYRTPVIKGTRLVARGEVRQKRDESNILWVKIYNKETEVYRGKFNFHIVG